MNANDERYLEGLIQATLQGRPTESPAEWATKNFVFDEPNNHGPFRMLGNEYVADVLNDFNRPGKTDFALVWGSQTKKTGTLMAGVAWRIVNDPCGMLWVMPNETLARRFSRQRLQKAFRATEPVLRLIPTGANHTHFSTLEMLIGGSILNFTGSNSPANVSSNPCQVVVMDEMDKFSEGSEKEADAGNLAEQRTKDQINPQRWRTSTPTLSGGLIWQEFLKGNQMRYFLPCPYCKAENVLAWSKRFTVLPLSGCEAFIAWDPKAKSAAGTWDLDRVKATAHAVCPHCRGVIGNEHKTAMVRDGRWKATNSSAPDSYVSRHLSSLYSTSPETSFGVLAVKFLQAKQSLNGLQGFINGDLAEPMEAQDTLGERIELVTPRIIKAEHTRLITVDCQAKAPYFWWTCREWGPGISRGVEFGSANTWEELDAVQERLGVQREGVAVDSGFGARSDAEVYGSCVRRAEILPQEQGLPIALGWVPTKGFPGRRLYKDPETGLNLPYYLRDVDPFEGSSDARRVRIGLLGFSTDYAKDLLEGLRQGRGSGVTWSVSEGMATEEYWRHLDAEIKETVRSKITGRISYVWKLRAQRWPNHIFDCEVMQVIFASYLGLFDIGPLNAPNAD